MIQKDRTRGVKTYDFRVVEPRTFEPHMYFMPIPQSEIDRSDIQQNPGYPGG